jgi:hypothetical protein
MIEACSCLALSESKSLSLLIAHEVDAEKIDGLKRMILDQEILPSNAISM